MAYSPSEESAFLSSANLAAIVGLPRVSFLIVRSSALSLARRKLFADVDADRKLTHWVNIQSARTK